MTGRRAAGVLAAVAALAIVAFLAMLILRETPSGPVPPDVGGGVPPDPTEANGTIRSGTRGDVPPPPATTPAENRGVLVPVPGAGPHRVGATESKALPPGLAWARLRLVSGHEKTPVPVDADPAVMLVIPRGRGALRLPQRIYPSGDGTVGVVSFGETGRPGGPLSLTEEEIRAGRYEIAAYGFATRTGFARGDLEGEHEIALEPTSPSAMGVLVAGPGLDAGRVSAELRGLDGRVLVNQVQVDTNPVLRVQVGSQVVPADGSGATSEPPVAYAYYRRPPRLPRALGPFALYEIPEGRWRLDVWVKQADGVLAHAYREFDQGAGTADLGTIEIRAPVTIRARVVGADGTGVLDRDLSVTPVGEGATGPQLPLENRAAFTGIEPDAHGWMEFRGLDPDTEYRVFSPSLKVEEIVRTPAGGTRVISVELRHELRGVRCRIRFTVNGADPVKWGEMFEGPTLDAGAWKKDGFLEQEMAPGQYLFGFFAQAVGTTDSKRYMAKFTVPDQAAWEPTIDLKEDL